MIARRSLVLFWLAGVATGVAAQDIPTPAAPEPPPALTGPKATLEEGVNAYYEGKYQKTLYLLVDELEGDSLETTYQQIRWEYSALSASMSGQDSLSAVYFQRLLRLEPYWRLASNQRAPSVMKNFDRASENLERERREAVAVQRQLLPASAWNIQPTRILPLGIPQFRRSEQRAGFAHFFLQTAGVALAIYSSARIASLSGGEFTSAEADAAATWQLAGLAGLGVSIGSWGISLWQRNFP